MRNKGRWLLREVHGQHVAWSTRKEIALEKAIQMQKTKPNKQTNKQILYTLYHVMDGLQVQK